MMSPVCDIHEGHWMGGDVTTCPICREIERLTKELNDTKAELDRAVWHAHDLRALLRRIANAHPEWADEVDALEGRDG